MESTEMMKLRNTLDKKGIQWDDKSVIYPENKIKFIMNRYNVSRETADFSILRTHFTYKEHFISVIFGYGTYGYESDLLEYRIDEDEPEGYLTADEILERMENL